MGFVPSSNFHPNLRRPCSSQINEPIDKCPPLLSARLAYRNIPRRKARTILTCAAIILGVALLVGINMATASAMNEFAGYINRFWGTTDIVVRYGSLAPFPDSIVNTVRSQGEITNTAARLEWPGIVSNSTIIQLVGVDTSHDFDYSNLNVTGVRSLQPGQALITDFLAQRLGLTIGSTFNVTALNGSGQRSEEHTSELQSLRHLVCRLLLEKKKKKISN